MPGCNMSCGATPQKCNDIYEFMVFEKKQLFKIIFKYILENNVDGYTT